MTALPLIIDARLAASWISDRFAARTVSPSEAVIMRRVTRLRLVALPLMVVLGLAAAGCSDDDGGAPTAATSGCDEVNALEDSLTSLTEVDLVSDGTDALQSAVSDVKTDLDAAVSAVGAELEPAVDEVQTAFGDLESALESISSEGLGAAATEIGNTLAELGTALTGLTTEISQTC